MKSILSALVCMALTLFMTLITDGMQQTRVPLRVAGNTTTIEFSPVFVADNGAYTGQEAAAGR